MKIAYVLIRESWGEMILGSADCKEVIGPLF
jgi:hypothetical protein